MTTLEEMLAKRPANRANVEAHKKRMLEEVRAHRLREIREAYGLTQTDIATLLHVGQNRVSQIEHGDIDKTRVDTLRKYAEAIGGTLKVEVEVGETSYQIA